MSKLLVTFLLILSALGLHAQHLNIKISSADSPNEPSICLDPKHPNRLVAGANLNNVYTSQDTGKTWTQAQMFSPYGVWGDPTIGVDTAGSFYFLHLSNPADGSWIDRIVIQKSNDVGQTWSPGTYTGLNNFKAQDKHWIAVDRNTNYLYISWTEFDHYGTSNPQDSSRILFSKSLDGGLNWSTPIRLNKISGDCIDSDNTTEGAVPCVGPNGEIYVVWAGPEGLVLDRSLDGGETWLDNEIKIGDFPGGWDYDIPGLGRCNGLPIIQCDLSGGPNHGTLYVNWSDQRNGSADTDVWIAKSTDGGNTWSAPIRVNTDGPGKQQFMCWMTVDQANGWLWLVYYDRRNYNTGKTDVYLAYSKDGGQSFKDFKISETAFTPGSGPFFGDYTNITAYNNIVRPIWTRQDGSNTSVWTALVDVTKATVSATAVKDDMLDGGPNYPNPASSTVWVPFKIRKHTLVTMQIGDNEGVVMHTVFADKVFEYGKYTEQVDLKKYALAAGSYWVMISGNGQTIAKKLIVVNP